MSPSSSLTTCHKFKELPPGCRAGDNAHTFPGGFRLWEEAGKWKASAPSGSQPVALRESSRTTHLGFSFLLTSHEPVGLLMLFCSGGILYLIFEDIAPQAHLKHHGFPAIGAVSGFLLGLVGTMLIH